MIVERGKAMRLSKEHPGQIVRVYRTHSGGFTVRFDSPDVRESAIENGLVLVASYQFGREVSF